MSNQNYYKANLRDLSFLLFEQFKLDELLGKAPYANWGKDEVLAVLEESYGWVQQYLGPYNTSGDAEGCRLENGQVHVPSGYKEAWKALFDAGWRTLAVEEKHGGQAGPFTLAMLVEEFMCGSNTSFNMYPALTQGAADVILAFGTPEQQSTYVANMFNGTWAGTMCLTEPHAGSDVGSASTIATKRADGKYDIRGTKIFISGGDQDMTGNIVHMVLARTPDAPAGTKGLSLFIVPKLRPDGTPNDVAVAGLEHKMGIKGSSTAQLVFGDNNSCIGELVGTQEQRGMSQMFHLMNYARIGVGIQSLALASSAYLNALSYAKDRKQGSSIKQWKDATAPRVPIIDHPDVKRMLLDMKARVEGIRALAVKLTMHIDRASAIEKTGGDKALAEYHTGQVDLLVPLVKSYGSDQGFQICATAIQVFGGAGFLRDWPVEQYCRDSKIFSIYEGTNHIQAMDLVGRKLMQRGGANVQAFGKDIAAFVAANKEHPVLKEGIAILAHAMESLTSTGGKFMQWFGGGKMEMVPTVANRFLEMMSETTVGWLLLEAAVIAEAALAKLPAEHPDRAFYEGKRYAAQYFAYNVLPNVTAKAQMIAREDRSALDIPAAAFAP
ncbi:MAG: acyl-CoA dehydrogenase [Deltaproteobacteria bacterium]|nr:acyl-CoA dehydrogenase [Deltaproteobacteria bacterium]MCW5806807.1 acyl-CoA dehydrogenase [Deltaproteobacteria bacterium]